MSDKYSKITEEARRNLTIYSAKEETNGTFRSLRPPFHGGHDWLTNF
jgi:hypothetical protein